MEINGLMKEAQYWIQFKKPKAGVKNIKKAKESDFDYL